VSADAQHAHAGRVTVVSDIPSSPFIDAWYDISTADHFWFRWRLRATLALLEGQALSPEQELTALEIGCGSGVLLSQLEDASRWRIDGTDLDHSALSRIGPGRGEIYLYDIHERLPEFAERYDVVVLFDVLEHIAETPRFIESVLFHLKPGGYLLLNVPSLMLLFSRYDEAAGHHRRYDKRSLAREFEDSPLEILEMRYWGLSMIPLLLVRKLIAPLMGSDDAMIERGFKPPGSLAAGVLKAVMRCETAVLKHPFAGTSLLMLARKR